MDFLEKIRALSAKIEKTKMHIKTEEAAKQSFVNPFIRALGFDETDPIEVEPEFTADIGSKKGEKVDYAIKMDGLPIMLIECKMPGVNLDDKSHMDQLMRYFGVTNSRIAILTNGILYRFFTDLEKPNVMDQRPFLAFNLQDVQDDLIAELQRFCKDKFNINEIIPAAAELKYTRLIKLILSDQIKSPTEEFVRFFAAQVYSGKLTAKVMEQFRDVTQRAIRQFINDQIAERLKSAMVTDDQIEPTLQKPMPIASNASRVDRKSDQIKEDSSRNPTKLANKRITMKDILDAGLMVAPAKLEVEYKKQNLTAMVEPDGSITFNGQLYPTPSAAGEAATQRQSCNGWAFWNYKDKDGKLLNLDELRKLLTNNSSV